MLKSVRDNKSQLPQDDLNKRVESVAKAVSDENRRPGDPINITDVEEAQDDPLVAVTVNLRESERFALQSLVLKNKSTKGSSGPKNVTAIVRLALKAAGYI